MSCGTGLFLHFKNSVLLSNNDAIVVRLWYCSVVLISSFECWVEGSDRVEQLPRPLCTPRTGGSVG